MLVHSAAANVGVLFLLGSVRVQSGFESGPIIVGSI